MKKALLLLLVASGSVAMAQITALSEDFEGAVLPDLWWQETAATDGGWLVGDADFQSSSAWPVEEHTVMIATNDDACNCNKLDDLLSTPSLSLVGMTSPYLVFDYYFGEFTYSGATEDLSVDVSLDGGINWTELVNLDGAGGSLYWRTASIDLGAYAGMSDVMIGFRYTDGGGWLYGAAIDDVKVYEPSPVDVELSALTFGQFQEVGTGVGITGTITNIGLDAITSVDITWTDGGTTETFTLDGISIPAFGTYNFTHEVDYVPASAISYDIDVELSEPNGVVDPTPENNTKGSVVSGCSYIPPKHMVAEEATGTWCGWCPRGAVFMDIMTEDFPEDFIGIAVHNSDPMEVTEYDNGVGAFPGFSGYPSVIIDRNEIVDPSQMPDVIDTRLADIAPVDMTIDLTYDEASHSISAEVTAEFVTQLSGINYRLNLVLTEDNVTGTGSGYAQTNYYAGGGYGPMGGYEDLPGTVPAADMIYQHVARGLASGWNGTSGSVPADVNAGDMASHTYEWDLDADWNASEMHAIGMIIDQNSGKILNAVSTKVSNSQPEAIEDFPGLAGLEVYPNPSSNVAYVRVNLENTMDVTMRITDINGQVMMARNYGNLYGDMLLTVPVSDMPAGMYLVEIISGAYQTTTRLMVAH